jgi:hypothetical protein
MPDCFFVYGLGAFVFDAEKKSLWAYSHLLHLLVYSYRDIKLCQEYLYVTALALSQKAKHFATSMFHIFYDTETEKRTFAVAKNKQEGGRFKQEIYLNTDTFTFNEFEVVVEEDKKVVVEEGSCT